MRFRRVFSPILKRDQYKKVIESFYFPLKVANFLSVGLYNKNEDILWRVTRDEGGIL